MWLVTEDRKRLINTNDIYKIEAWFTNSVMALMRDGTLEMLGEYDTQEDVARAVKELSRRILLDGLGGRETVLMPTKEESTEEAEKARQTAEASVKKRRVRSFLREYGYLLIAFFIPCGIFAAYIILHAMGVAA